MTTKNGRRGCVARYAPFRSARWTGDRANLAPQEGRVERRVPQLLSHNRVDSSVNSKSLFRGIMPGDLDRGARLEAVGRSDEHNHDTRPSCHSLEISAGWPLARLCVSLRHEAPVPTETPSSSLTTTHVLHNS